jgi:dienelactone hydrolase
MMRDKRWLALIFAMVWAPVAAMALGAESDDGLAGHWRLAGDCRDSSSAANHGVNHHAVLGPDGALFNGTDSYIEVPDAKSLALGKGDFSIALWVYTEAELDDVLGDLLSKYDPATRTGVNLTLMNSAGVTCAQSNWRNLSFGIDAGRIDKGWTDCGRPGNNVYVLSLCVWEGHLYAGAYEQGADETGHIYRYDGGQRWTDCGSPDAANGIGGMAVYEGHLYAGSTRYNAGGSALEGSPNEAPGGRVFRYEGGTRWTDCGRLGQANEVFSMVVFKGKLYAAPLYKEGKGLYRYEGGTRWAWCGAAPEDRRVEPLTVYNGRLYAGSYDKGHVVRYDGGQAWTELGTPPDTTQIYSFAVHQGRLLCCTWPKATVFACDGDKGWISMGRQGEEKETMAVSVYNGKLYVGTLPLAQVYRHDGGTTWTCTGQLDTTPDVKYRRAWSMAVYNGRLYCGTLPSGRVYSLEAGKCATNDRELPAGWRHVAAVKTGGRLRLYVDGKQVAVSSAFDPAEYDLSTAGPLRIGFGEHDYFKGKLRDLRLYRRALTEAEIGALASQTRGETAEKGPQDWPQRRRHILAKMELVMGPLPARDGCVPLDVRVLQTERLAKVTRKKITYAATKDYRVPAYLLIPNELKAPTAAMLCLHGTGGSQGRTAGLGADYPRYTLELAERGYVTIAPDYPLLGENQTDPYPLGFQSGTMKGIWDHMRAVDLLESLPEVDRERMGCIGVSLGGHNALFIGAFDPRMKVVVSSCGFDSFADYKGGDLSGWCQKLYMPRIDSAYGKDPKRVPFDFPEVLAAIAPRPLYVHAPLGDDNFRVESVKRCVEAARAVYRLLDAGNRLVAVYPPGSHDFPSAARQQAYQFIDKALAMPRPER